MDQSDEAVLTRQATRQAEAARVMDDLDVMALLARVGRPVHTGSSALGLLVGRDIDVTTLCPSLDLTPVFEVGHALATHRRVRRLTFRNDTGAWNTEPEYPDGLYWLVDYVAEDGEPWTLDLWLIPEGTTQYDLEHMRTLPARLDAPHRATILRIKEARQGRPELPRLPSYRIYEAVLDHGVRTPAEFEAYLARP
jgi:hypothetical protein